MPQETPDLRTFNASVAKDHALYDGALVKVFEPYSNWTRSAMGPVPFGVEHFRYHTQQKLAEHLRHAPDEGLSHGIAKQDLSDRRLLLQHLAHSFTVYWGREVHTFGGDVQEMLMRVRNNMNMLAIHKQLFIEDEGNPLRQHHRVKFHDTDAGAQPAIPMKAEDVALAKYIAGPNPHIHRDPATNKYTQDILLASQPFLAEVDDTNIRRKLLGLRTKMRELLKHEAFLHPDLRTKLLKEISADWEKAFTAEENIAAITAAEEEMSETAGIPSVLNEEVEVVLEKCFGTVLAADTLDDETKQKLLRWRPVLENFAFSAINDGKFELFQGKIVPMLHRYIGKLDMHFGELDHLGIIFAAYADDLELSDFRDRYLI